MSGNSEMNQLAAEDAGIQSEYNHDRAFMIDEIRCFFRHFCHLHATTPSTSDAIIDIVYQRDVNPSLKCV